MALEGKIEAVLFVSGNPVHFDKLCEIFSLTPDEMLSELQSLEKIKAKDDSGLSLVKLDGAYQLCTKQETSDYVKKFLEMKKAPPLSKAALEVLAITAYHQPVTRSFIEQVRGIESSSIVAGLEEKGLLMECGHLDAPGRPALFTTTETFLRSFGLESLDDLPVLPEEYSLDNGQMSLDMELSNSGNTVETSDSTEEDGSSSSHEVVSEKNISAPSSDELLSENDIDELHNTDTTKQIEEKASDASIASKSEML